MPTLLKEDENLIKNKVKIKDELYWALHTITTMDLLIQSLANEVNESSSYKLDTWTLTEALRSRIGTVLEVLDGKEFALEK